MSGYLALESRARLSYEYAAFPAGTFLNTIVFAELYAANA